MITGYKWELYNVQEDPTQSNDLAAKMPEKLKQMQDLFYLPRRRSTTCCRSTTRRSRAGIRPAAEPDGGTNGLHLFGRTDRRAATAVPRTS